MREITTLRDVPELLHDATLASLSWNASAHELRLRFRCLRRGLDGSRIADPFVELRLSGVLAVAIDYSSADQSEPPSRFSIPAEAQLASLDPWTVPERETPLRIDDPAADEDRQFAAQVEWLVGTDAELTASSHRFALELPVAARTHRTMTIGCADVEPWAQGSVLELDRWADEYDAWWKGWAKDADPKSPFIPAGPDEELPKGYRPPDEPVFEIAPTGAPPEPLAAAGAWFEHEHTRDRKPYEHDWPYAREIVEGWCEERHGYLRIDGIRHTGPDSETPAENMVGYWELSLRRRGEEWQVHRSASGVDIESTTLPRWAARWRSGPVELSALQPWDDDEDEDEDEDDE